MSEQPGSRREISVRTTETVRRWIAVGLSDREIVRRSGLHRAKVRKIRKGEPVGQANSDVSFERCPGCGRLVTMPCRACAVNDEMQTAPAQQRPAAAGHNAVCGECKKTTSDLYYVNPITNRLTAEPRCADCQELATARAARGRLEDSEQTDFHTLRTF